MVQTGRVSQIPCSSGTVIQPAVIEIVLREELPGRDRVDDGQVGIEKTSPTPNRPISSTLIKEGPPFFRDEISIPSISRTRVDGNHMDSTHMSLAVMNFNLMLNLRLPLDKLDIRSKIRYMINFVLKELSHLLARFSDT